MIYAELDSSDAFKRIARRIVIGLCALAVAGCGSKATMGHGPRKFAITHVNIVDATGAPTRHDMTVIVQGGKIADISPASSAPRIGVPVINGAGKYLIPGLNDMHAHQTQDTHFVGPLMIANGVTGVRDMFARDLSAIQERRREVAEGALHPNILLAGEIVDGDPPTWPGSIPVRDAAEGRAAVDRVKREGYDFVKVYSRLTPDAYFAIVREAKRIGIPFEGHVPDSITVSEASDAGQRSVEHMMDIGESCSSRARELHAAIFTALKHGHASSAFLAAKKVIAPTFDMARCAELSRKFVRNQTWLVPTLTVMRVNGGMTDPAVYNPPHMEYVPYLTRWMWGVIRSFAASSIKPADVEPLKAGFFDLNVRIVGQMHKAHVPIMTGTDEPNAFVIPGFSLHDELSNLVKAGFTPMEALQASTIMPAKFLHRERTMGTVEVGKNANLVLLNADPLADIDNTKKIDAVILNGQFVSREELDALLDYAHASRWRLGGVGLTYLHVLFLQLKWILGAAALVIAALIAGGIYLLRRRRRRKRLDITS